MASEKPTKKTCSKKQIPENGKYIIDRIKRTVDITSEEWTYAK